MNQVLTRIHKLDDGTEITQREWVSDYGLSFWCPEKSCVFCKRCSDIFFDSAGPYMFFCELENDVSSKDAELTYLGYKGKCDRFEEDDDIEQRNNENREAMKKAKELMQNEELVESFRKAAKDYFDRMFCELTDIREFPKGW